MSLERALRACRRARRIHRDEIDRPVIDVIVEGPAASGKETYRDDGDGGAGKVLGEQSWQS